MFFKGEITYLISLKGQLKKKRLEYSGLGRQMIKSSSECSFYFTNISNCSFIKLFSLLIVLTSLSYTQNTLFSNF